MAVNDWCTVKYYVDRCLSDWEDVINRFSIIDQVSLVSNSIFIYNFPSHFSLCEFWSIGERFGEVSDVYIVPKKTIRGEMFGFVRFLKKVNVEAVVAKFCNLRTGRLKLFANASKFLRNAVIDQRKVDPEMMPSHVRGGILPKQPTFFNKDRPPKSFAETARESVDINNSEVVNIVPSCVIDHERCILVLISKDRPPKSFANGVKLMVILVYAPQQLSAKRVLWQTICNLIDHWDGECIIMGDYNEVRVASESLGSVFSQHDADAFNDFIRQPELIDVPMGGFSFTWANSHATKMNKLDRFLVSEGMFGVMPDLLGLVLDHHLSNHRPILLKEMSVDYATRDLFDFDGFDSVVVDSWNNDGTVEVNGLISFKKKLQVLKSKLRERINNRRREMAANKNDT